MQKFCAGVRAYAVRTPAQDSDRLAPVNMAVASRVSTDTMQPAHVRTLSYALRVHAPSSNMAPSRTRTVRAFVVAGPHVRRQVVR